VAGPIRALALTQNPKGKGRFHQQPAWYAHQPLPFISAPEREDAMKNTIFMSMRIATAVVVLSTAAVGAMDVLDERMFEGTVLSKGYVIEGLMYFPLKTATGVLEVQIGPKDFVERGGFKPKIGEMVSVIGVPAILEGRKAVLAREVRHKSTVFVVRDRNGEPIWDPNRPVQMDTDFPESTVCEMIKP
jgi:hypothetical protein